MRMGFFYSEYSKYDGWLNSEQDFSCSQTIQKLLGSTQNFFQSLLSLILLKQPPILAAKPGRTVIHIMSELA
jgi:hypothetical protein